MTDTIAGPTVQELLRLRDDAGVLVDADRGVGIGMRFLVQRLGRLGPAEQELLAAVRAGWASETDLLSAARTAGGEPGVAAAARLLGVLRTGGWLASRLLGDGREMVEIRPTGTGPTSHRGPVAPGAHLVLSRFTVLRGQDGALRVESPCASCVVDVFDRDLAGALAALAVPRARAELAGVPDAVLTPLLEHGFVVAAGTEDTDLRSSQWSPHELWFHSRSRLGRHELPYGGTYWADQRFPAAPLRHPGFGGVGEPLPKPDPVVPWPDAPSLADVLEARRSVRQHDADAPITAEQLGHFLYRCARVRETSWRHGQQLSRRPYPGGGAIYELEIYPVVTAVTGIEPGMYHYDPLDHAIERVPARQPYVDMLVATATEISLMTAPPQVLLVIAARFERFLWKYQTMAYAATLKNVGALYTTMYLVATAMGLAPCALGGGDSDVFARATGLDYLSESSVGEFLLGS